MGPPGLGQRVGVGEGVKKKKNAYIFKIHFFTIKKNKKSEAGRAFVVAPKVIDGEGGVEGQMEELKNCAL